MWRARPRLCDAMRALALLECNLTNNICIHCAPKAAQPAFQQLHAVSSAVMDLPQATAMTDASLCNSNHHTYSLPAGSMYRLIQQLQQLLAPATSSTACTSTDSGQAPQGRAFHGQLAGTSTLSQTRPLRIMDEDEFPSHTQPNTFAALPATPHLRLSAHSVLHPNTLTTRWSWLPPAQAKSASAAHWTCSQPMRASIIDHSTPRCCLQVAHSCTAHSQADSCTKPQHHLVWQANKQTNTRARRNLTLQHPTRMLACWWRFPTHDSLKPI